jgi:hypothetical protein
MEQQSNSNDRKIGENTEYNDPITGRFVKGNPGKPIGAKSFATDFDEVVEEIAKANNITQSEARKILLKSAYKEAKDGNFNFYKDIVDRYYGKAPDNLDIKLGSGIDDAKFESLMESYAQRRNKKGDTQEIV